MFAWAVENHTPLVCRYGGHRREICPIIVGHSEGEEATLVWQMGGETSGGPLIKGEWKCLKLAMVRSQEIGEGSWQVGLSHQQAQSCVKEVDYDANPDSPYAPTHSLGRLREIPLD
jgi:hypothetical protein